MTRNYPYAVIISISLMGCLTEIDFEDKGKATTISGVLTNDTASREIFVTRADGISNEGQPMQASGVVFKNGNVDVELIQKEIGVLSLPPSFEVEEGAIYYVEIITPDNQVYQSIPQKVPPKHKTDSISFQIVEKEASINTTGEIVNNYFVDFFAHVTLPDPKDTVYYKWQIDQSWNFVSEARICYKIRNERANEVALLSSNGRLAGPFKVRIASQEMDKSFSYKHYFNVNLFMIDKQTYEFYQKVQQLVNHSGNLYDEIPAPFKGNVFLDAGEAETVLGNIEFSAGGELLRFPIDSFMINERIDFFRVCEDTPGCGANAGPFDPCSKPHSCFDCLISPLGDTIKWDDKPNYFVD